jgi:hypothetical protein
MRCVLRAKNPSRRDARFADHVVERIGQLIDVLRLEPAASAETARAMVA